MKSVTFNFFENATDENQNQVQSEVLGLPRCETSAASVQMRRNPR
jgi:hypothetical protein